jgi:hypothetical protein
MSRTVHLRPLAEEAKIEAAKEQIERLSRTIDRLVAMTDAREFQRKLDTAKKEVSWAKDRANAPLETRRRIKEAVADLDKLRRATRADRAAATGDLRSAEIDIAQPR